jgi:hypothetical protein
MVVFNKAQRSGVKKPFRLEEIWRIREIENSLMQLALLNLTIDSKLRASDLLSLRVCDVTSLFIPATTQNTASWRNWYKHWL